MRFFSTLIASTLGALLALLIVMFVGFLFLLALAASSSSVPAVRSGSVLVMDLSGPILEQVSDDPLARAFADEPAFDLYDVTHALEKAAADDRIEGVWLKTHGTAAPWAALQEIRKAVIDFKASGKPVYASSDEYNMREADYFVASAADSVFATAESFFEFNGFALDVLFYTNLLDKLDVDAQVVRAGAFKSAVEPFFRTDLSEENELQLQALLASQNDVFLQRIAESRGWTAAEVQSTMETQALLTADEAHEAGLLDALLFKDGVEQQWKARLGLEDDDDLRTINLRSYRRVPPDDAGLTVGDDEIAVVYAVGTIVPGESTTAGLLGSETLGKALRRVRDDDDVKAVVLRIDSPGGSAAASDAMWREIRLTADEKPVVVSMGGVAASGGYWIATAGDAIVADATTLTGSIGVFALLFDVGGFLDNQLGITHDGVRTSPYADMFSALRPLAEPERGLLERAIDDTYQRFLEKVAKARGLNVAQVDSIAQGRIWSGVHAKEVGLVDELGDLDAAVALAAEKADLDEDDYRLRLLPEPPTFMDALNEAFSARVAQGWQRLYTTPAEHALLRQIRTLEQIVDMQGTVQARLPLEITIR